MKLLLSLLLLLFPTTLTQSQEISKYLPSLESNVYTERAKSREEIEGAILKKENLDELKSILKSNPTISLQVRFTLEDILYEKYEVILKRTYPIWHLPDENRFEGGKDVALKYYLEYNPKPKLYNHSKYMRDATKAYFRDQILNSDKTYFDLLKLAVQMKMNKRREDTAIAGIFRYNYYNCYDVEYKSVLASPPMRYNIRILFLEKAAEYNYQEAYIEDNDKKDELDFAVTDHDKEISFYCWEF